MSIEATAWALKKADVPDPIAHLVLIGLADHATDDGSGAWPSVSTLAKYARCSERSVQRKLRALEEWGTIVQGDQRIVAHIRSDRRPIVWNLPIYGVSQSHPVDGHGVTGQAPRGDRPGSHEVTAVSPKPYLNHPEPAAAAGTASPVENPTPLAELEKALTAVDQFEFVSFVVPADAADTITDLVVAHGVQRLVKAARATTAAGRVIRRVDAFIPTWSELRTRALTSVSDEARCDECTLPVSACDSHAAAQDPEHRCRGAEDRIDGRHTA